VSQAIPWKAPVGKRGLSFSLNNRPLKTLEEMHMQYLIQIGQATIKYSGLDKMSEEFQKIFRFMFYVQATELIKGDVKFSIEG
jgi:hypothetical protein